MNNYKHHDHFESGHGVRSVLRPREIFNTCAVSPPRKLFFLIFFSSLSAHLLNHSLSRKMASLPDFSADTGLSTLEKYLSTRSYIDG